MSDNLRVGKLGENYAVRHLENLGYKIVDRGFRKKHGDIDIVAVDKDCLVIVEVKTRLDENFPPEEAIDQWKLKMLEQNAEYYSLLHPKLPKLLRIDLVAIELHSNFSIKRIQLYKNISQ